MPSSRQRGKREPRGEETSSGHSQVFLGKDGTDFSVFLTRNQELSCCQELGVMQLFCMVAFAGKKAFILTSLIGFQLPLHSQLGNRYRVNTATE